MSTEQTDAGADLQSGPGNVSGWDRSAVEALLARSGADATDHELRQVVALLADRDRLHTWHGLMSVLDQHYPPNVPLGPDSDPGPRILALTRALDAARADRWRQRAETARLRDALDAGPDVPDAGLAPLAGTYRQALERAVAANREQTAEVERLRDCGQETTDDH
jgi:hypothetical protein